MLTLFNERRGAAFGVVRSMLENIVLTGLFSMEDSAIFANDHVTAAKEPSSQGRCMSRRENATEKWRRSLMLLLILTISIQSVYQIQL